jgi:hypothetical protein
MKLFTIMRWWMRLGRLGWGLAWKPVTDRMLFSERYGYERWYRVGGWKFHILRPVARCLQHDERER